MLLDKCANVTLVADRLVKSENYQTGTIQMTGVVNGIQISDSTCCSSYKVFV